MAITTGRNASITTGAVQVDSTSTATIDATLQADPANTANILIGGATPHIVLLPGQSIMIPVLDISLVYARSVSGTQAVNWLLRS